MLAHYGVRVRPTYVLDEQAFVQVQPNERGDMTESRIAFVPIVRRSEMDTSWPPLQRAADLGRWRS